MLDRRHRLTSATGFATAVRRGRRAGRRTLVVHVHQSPEPGPPLVGFVVGRAVGNAVTRNSVKRRLRHLARERLASLPGSAVLVVRALPPAAAATYAELGSDLDSALSRLGAAAGTAVPSGTLR
ncbi:MAG: ribonuclease P protein component [Nocardioidaceae bacterium]|nr:ribonuclease P protein component [Nocardioidaceae bacterium]NUS51206.1 ribonuclease P protein component [Nocardioidaceae bacterium]